MLYHSHIFKFYACPGSLSGCDLHPTYTREYEIQKWLQKFGEILQNSQGIIGSKRTQMFIANYAQEMSNRLRLGLRFLTLGPPLVLFFLDE
jgi:hypothetical protein